MHPDYIDAQYFAAFLESRMAHKAPFTPRAEQMLVKKLMRHHEEGWDVNAALEESVINGWKSVYPKVKRAGYTQEEIERRIREEKRKLAVPCPPDIMAKIKASIKSIS